MSDKSPDDRIRDLQEGFRKFGHELSPETISNLEDKLRAEERLKAELAAQKLATPVPEQLIGNPSVLRRDQPVAAGEPQGPAEMPSLRRIQPVEQPQTLQPSAYGERAMTTRAETGPEKKDLERFLAKPPETSEGSAEQKKWNAEDRISRL